MNKIFNLTQHKATQDQAEAGVRDLPIQYQRTLHSILTVETCPKHNDILDIVDNIEDLITSIAWCDGKNTPRSYHMSVMIGGAPWLMHPLHSRLEEMGVEVRYAFSSRVSEETICPETGTVFKSSEFRHIGWAGEK